MPPGAEPGHPAAPGLGVTRAGAWLKHQIPIRTFADWDEARPGFLEGDLVAHCGPTTLGFYLCTLCAVDLVTGWTEHEPPLALSKKVKGYVPNPVGDERFNTVQPQ